MRTAVNTVTSAVIPHDLDAVAAAGARWPNEPAGMVNWSSAYRAEASSMEHVFAARGAMTAFSTEDEAETKRETGEHRGTTDPRENWRKAHEPHHSDADSPSRDEKCLPPPNRAAKLICDGPELSSIVLHASDRRLVSVANPDASREGSDRETARLPSIGHRGRRPRHLVATHLPRLDERALRRECVSPQSCFLSATPRQTPGSDLWDHRAELRHRLSREWAG